MTTTCPRCDKTVKLSPHGYPATHKVTKDFVHPVTGETLACTVRCTDRSSS